MQKIQVHRDDIAKVQSILDIFPEVDFFDVFIDNSSGIGTTIVMRISQRLRDIEGIFEIPIATIDDW